MKKIFAVALALVLTMAMFCASAETVSFSFATVLDAEGNPYEGEGDTSELADTVITIDDEANTIAITDAETTNGTIETEVTEEGVAIVATMETGVELAFVCSEAEDGTKLLTLVQENDLYIVFAAA